MEYTIIKQPMKNMKATGRMEKDTEKAYILIQMGLNMKGSTRKK